MSTRVRIPYTAALTVTSKAQPLILKLIDKEQLDALVLRYYNPTRIDRKRFAVLETVKTNVKTVITPIYHASLRISIF